MAQSSRFKLSVAVVGLVLFLPVWVWVFMAFSENSLQLFPAKTYEVYALTDGAVGGFSTSELSLSDSSASAKVNIRSGVAYAYAGLGLNLRSVDNRPADFFDFSQFDSMAVRVETGRMKKVVVRLMNDDPVYSKDAVSNYRPLEASLNVPVRASDEVLVALSSLRVPEWWLASQGLEGDDGLRHMQRGVLLELFNGEGALRGIPDEISLHSIRLWGENRTFKNLMFLILGLFIATFVVSIYLIRKKK